MNATTVIIPTFNEAPNVAELVRRLNEPSLPTGSEILFVDDSSDDTPAAITDASGWSAVPVRMIHRDGPGRRPQRRRRRGHAVRDDRLVRRHGRRPAASARDGARAHGDGLGNRCRRRRGLAPRRRRQQRGSVGLHASARVERVHRRDARDVPQSPPQLHRSHDGVLRAPPLVDRCRRAFSRGGSRSSSRSSRVSASRSSRSRSSSASGTPASRRQTSSRASASSASSRRCASDGCRASPSSAVSEPS